MVVDCTYAFFCILHFGRSLRRIGLQLRSLELEMEMKKKGRMIALLHYMKISRVKHVSTSKRLSFLHTACSMPVGVCCAPSQNIFRSMWSRPRCCMYVTFKARKLRKGIVRLMVPPALVDRHDQCRLSIEALFPLD